MGEKMKRSDFLQIEYYIAGTHVEDPDSLYSDTLRIIDICALVMTAEQRAEVYEKFLAIKEQIHKDDPEKDLRFK
jgi:hypothetical protein